MEDTRENFAFLTNLHDVFVLFLFRQRKTMLLSCLKNKKVTKEVGTGEALKAVLPHVPAALSCVPLPARTISPRSILTYILFKQKVFRLSA